MKAREEENKKEYYEERNSLEQKQSQINAIFNKYKGEAEYFEQQYKLARGILIIVLKSFQVLNIPTIFNIPRSFLCE